ncbi:related to gyp5-gtpase-activating protein [Ceraceosorus bombacis]|uniref:Related to gyp5-gtpase-activating protein n=1 Tax=Ceraceosorus bombacis TaxID=401625 RepID=A0A0P1BE65_9BASI|nr:related to gyp5-gtpase-activating protein [Ceraceosorus bombacis]
MSRASSTADDASGSEDEFAEAQPSLSDELADDSLARVANGAEGSDSKRSSGDAKQTIDAASKVHQAKDAKPFASRSPSPVKTNSPPRAKGAGVAALMERFQGGRSTPPSSAQAKTASKPSGGEQPSSSASSSVKLSAPTAVAPQEMSDSNVESQLIADKDELPPSKGATSLLDPEETIKNPFSSSSGAATPIAPTTPATSTGPGAFQNGAGEDAAGRSTPTKEFAGGSGSSDHSVTSSAPPQRFSTVSDAGQASTSRWADEAGVGSGPTVASDTAVAQGVSASSVSGLSDGAAETPTGQEARFSRVSLTSRDGDANAPQHSRKASDRRKTVMMGGVSFAPEAGSSATNTEGSASFLARQTARMSRDEEAIRNSTDSAEKLKESFDRLQMREKRKSLHAKSDSSSRSNAIEGETQSAGAETSSAVVSNEAITPSRSGGTDTWDGPPAEDLGEEATDWDFWGGVMSNYQEVAQTQPRELSRAIQAGIPAALRGMMWQLMSSSKSEEMEIVYAYYLKQTTPHEKNIRKDLARTFPEQEYFADGKGVGQENLFNVIKAYSLFDEECGYCQGMQFVVGPLLLNMPDEEAFSTLVRLMKSYDLRGHFIVGMPRLQLRLFQFDRLLEELLPLLYRHLVRQGIKSSMYASSWFMTCHVLALRSLLAARNSPSITYPTTCSAYRMPLGIIYRVLDSVFAEGIEALFRFAIALMQKNEDRLLTLGFDEAIPLLAVNVADVYRKADPPGSERLSAGKAEYRVNEFVRDAFQVHITPLMLDQYAAEFEEQVKAANAHRREVEALRLVNRNLSAKVKALEEQLTQVNAEHVDLVKSVVMAKLAKEEMAEELVRYKMMYAEAALLADQSRENGRSPGSERPPSHQNWPLGRQSSS